jgi:ribosome maturation factor RimP
MFLANSHPVTILFDSRASHSFISSQFVENHNLPITIMKYTMIVSSPGIEMKTKCICPSISIAIRGVDFLSNLIIIDSKGIDIILGTNWLRKYAKVILCAKRAIQLTREVGTTVEFVAAISANQISMLNQVKGTSLEEIRIVQDYLDVFSRGIDRYATPLTYQVHH